MNHRCLRFGFILLLGIVLAIPTHAGPLPESKPVKIIFDTDIGNDVDDVLALSLLHALQSRGNCQLLAVTVTKPDELAGPFVDAINTFYGRPEIPIACIKPDPGEESGKYLRLANATDEGKRLYPHKLLRGSDTEAPVPFLRKLLNAQDDHSVVMVQVGYFSNLAALLESQGDAISPLTGRELVSKKIKFLSVMAASFKPLGTNNHVLEYNVVKDLPAAKVVCKAWPTPIIWSGAEIGVAVPYPAKSIQRDFNYVFHHPVAEAYYLYRPPPHERPCWDLTSVLYAIFPDRDYFDLSPPGNVTLEADGFSRFEAHPQGRDRYLILTPMQATRVKEAFVQLVSQRPNRLNNN